jgi:dipeptidyl aminopeptidase/acylaminoacyl peptidase
MLLGIAPGFGHGTLFPYVASDAFDPGNVWVTDARFAAARRISNENADLRNASLGHIRVITWHSRNGELLHGALLLPGNYRMGIRYPMMVVVYAGDMGSTFANTFGLWDTAYLDMQFLASRGYAVLYPDIPIHPALHSPMQDVYDAVMPGVDRAISLGIADPQKLAVMGQSFGGYNTIGILTQTTRFKAAIATSPAPTELFEGYLASEGMGMGYYELGQADMGCTPWECRDRYIANSPLLFLDRVTTPLLLEGGLNDHISFENQQIFSGLQRLGKEVELLEYADEQHELTDPANIVDFWTRALKFLDTHLESSSSNS